MPIAIACPSCGLKGQVPDEFHGRRVKCSKCQTYFTATAVVQPPPPVPEVKKPTRKTPEDQPAALIMMDDHPHAGGSAEPRPVSS
jgi:hypothetical protein